MAETSAAAGMQDYLAYWACAGATGRLRIRAPNAATARRDIEQNASRYGLPHERVTVLKLLRCVTIEPEDARVRHG